jgi:hypothetical protein
MQPVNSCNSTREKPEHPPMLGVRSLGNLLQNGLNLFLQAGQLLDRLPDSI